MPKADHYAKKNGAAHEAHARRKREANENNSTAKQFQRIFRINALKERAAAKRLTEKNDREIAALGITI